MHDASDSRPRQLPLDVVFADAMIFETFEPMAEAKGLDWLRLRIADLESKRGVAERGWFWGASGCGRSHLLQAACRGLAKTGGRVAYLTPEIITAAPQAALADLECCDLIALDDVDSCAGSQEVEHALFDLCNRLVNRPRPSLMLCAAAAAPLACGFQLLDLASRLAAATVFRIPTLDDRGRGRALQRRAVRRGIRLDSRVVDYILAHFPRDTHALFALLDDLDEESLSAQRRVTLPFVRELLVRRRSS